VSTIIDLDPSDSPGYTRGVGAYARSLLVSLIPGRLDEAVADELLAETRGRSRSRPERVFVAG
jgi:hypothetical protein